MNSRYKSKCKTCQGTGHLINWFKVPLGKEKDRAIAELLGVFRETVTLNRIKLGIKPYQKRKVK